MEKMHIMIVEDDETLAREIKDFFDEMGILCCYRNTF